ncbi:MAG TPA: AtaL-like protein [Methylibium sp.]|nr:AtaL-like protein [Methylibium sp.]
MRFEHVLQVTDPADPRVPPMGRAELWRGLLRRVDAPQDFPLGPDRCSARPDAGGEERHRTIHFGNLVFEDRVRLEPERRIVFTPQPHEGVAPVRLTITLEEPAPAMLCLRFVYEVEGEASDEERALQRYREQAWLEMDRDMLRTLREWQAAGAL